jgi:hypothetical protein
MMNYEEQIRALKTAIFAIERIVSRRAHGQQPGSFDANARGFAKGIQVSVEQAREMMNAPLSEIFQIDMEDRATSLPDD